MKRSKFLNQQRQQRYPVLLSNIEVYEILQKRVQQRAASNAIHDYESVSTNSIRRVHRQVSKSNPHHRNRDWLEEKVVQYCQGTSCMKLGTLSNANRLGELLMNPKKTIMKSSKAKEINAGIFMKSEPKSDSNGEFNPIVSEQQGLDPVVDDDIDDDENAKVSTLSGFGLMEGETIQILNYVPTEIVEVHLMIEDLQSRMTESEQDMLLKKIAEYCLATSSPGVVGEKIREAADEDENDVSTVIANNYTDSERKPAANISDKRKTSTSNSNGQNGRIEAETTNRKRGLVSEDGNNTTATIPTTNGQKPVEKKVKTEI